MNLDFSNINVLLVGDFMLDHYFYGTSDRQSPENPVPVISPLKEKFFAGGAGNVAMNIISMGGNVFPVGVIGNDFGGRVLIDIFEKSGMNKDYLISSDLFKTTVKKRIFSNDIPIARIDSEEIIDSSILIDTFNKVKNIIDDIDILIISDYDKGVIDKMSAKFLIDMCNRNNIPILVDPKKSDFMIYKNATIITPNLLEMQNAIEMDSDFEKIIPSCFSLINEINIEAFVVTRSDKGISLISNNTVFSVDGKKIENPDVTGGGDTVISTLALSFCCGNSLEESIEIANNAATSVVREQGTAYATIDGIKKELLVK